METIGLINNNSFNKYRDAISIHLNYCLSNGYDLDQLFIDSQIEESEIIKKGNFNTLINDFSFRNKRLLIFNSRDIYKYSSTSIHRSILIYLFTSVALRIPESFREFPGFTEKFKYPILNDSILLFLSIINSLIWVISSYIFGRYAQTRSPGASP